MKDGLLSYNGASYRLTGPDISRLLASGVIVADASTPGSYALAPEHLIEELGAAARSDAANPPWLGRADLAPERPIVMDVHRKR